MQYADGKRRAFTEKGLLNTNADHVRLVRDKVDKLNQRVALGIVDERYTLPTAGQKLHAALDLWLTFRQSRVVNSRLSPLTLKDNRETVTIAKAIITDTGLSKVSLQIAEDFVKDLRQLPRRRELGIKSFAEFHPGMIRKEYRYTPRTDEDIHRHCRNLAVAFQWMVKEGLIKLNPFRPLPDLQIKNSRDHIKVFRPSEISAFQDYFKSKPPAHGAAFGFSLETGARAGGIVSLNEKDIFIEIIDGIPATLAWLHEKRNKSRIIYLSDEALCHLDIMREWMGKVNQYVNRFMVRKDPAIYRDRVAQGLIFFPFVNSGSVSQMFIRAKRVLGIKGKFHDARKTRTTDLFDLGMNKDVIRNQMGWASNAVMDNHYLQITLTRIVREAREVEAKRR